MKFIGKFVVIYVILGAFLSLGGWMLFDFSRHFYLAAAACALVITAAVSVIIYLALKVEELEVRMKALEEKDSAAQ